MTSESSPPPDDGRKPAIIKGMFLLLESLLDSIQHTVARISGQHRKPMTTQIYFAVHHNRGLTVKGRVLRIRTWKRPRKNDHPLVNLWQMLKLWATPEIADALVRIEYAGEVVDTHSDEEGYFEITLQIPPAGNKKIHISLPESENSSDTKIRPKVSTPHSRCLIVSDIDDTILVTHAAKTLRMIGTTLFGNALTRQIFPGTPELYQALEEGVAYNEEGSENNPFVYVTSSPYNLHGLIQLIFRKNKIPGGSYFMTDWGLDRDKWLRKSHGDHKISSIRKSLDWYPERPVLLIGDSGQHDVFIYTRIARDYPDRIAQIIIRNVSDSNRIESLSREAEKIKDLEIPFTFVDDSVEAAEVLRQGGWITGEQFESIQIAFEEDSETPLDKLIHQT